MNTNNAHISQKVGVSKAIYNITPFTLLDYQDKTACILWFAGCNMRCSYCYNPEIVFGKGKFSFDNVLDFLSKRVNLLDAVVLSGGECTMHKNLYELIRRIKGLGYLVKIDTNGSNPELINELIGDSLIDFIALDFKAPSYKYTNVTASDLFQKFEETLKILLKNKFPFEVRSTVHSDLISPPDFQNMLNYLKIQGYKGKYYLQNFLKAPETIGNIGPSVKNYLLPETFDTSLELIWRNA